MSVGRNPQVRFLKVEKATEYESYRRIPKYSHIAMGVIHPSTMKKSTPPKVKSPELTLSAS